MAKKVTENKVASKKKTATPTTLVKTIVSAPKKTVKTSVVKEDKKKTTLSAKETLKEPIKTKAKEVIVLKNMPQKLIKKISPTAPIEEVKTKRKYIKKSEKENVVKVIIPENNIEISISSEKPRTVKSILISLPKPESGKSPYIDLATQFKIKIDWKPFTQVDGIKALDFRLQRIYLDKFQHVIFTSKTSIEQYFRMLEDMRIKVSQDNKYFCLNEAIALYLQKYINYRKRKVFFGDGKLPKLMEVILKNKDKSGDAIYLIPSSETKDKLLTETLKAYHIEYQEAILYRTIASDLSDLKDVKYDMLVFFNSTAIDSLYSNFPDFVQDKTRLAIFGKSTGEAAIIHKLRVDVFAPSPENPSLVDAIKKYIAVGNKK